MVHEKVPNVTPSSSSRNEKHELFADSDKIGEGLILGPKGQDLLDFRETQV
ncbi:hypothetical protein HanIR_Chr06g0259051 [Helianthus annuus]|nr:hypothetical protein HanIR_Chr06g0259051 [Helianthus annuus]